MPPQRAGATSYLTLLSGALQSAGIEVTPRGVGDLWRVGWTREADVVHLHWLEFIAPSAPGGASGLARTVVRHMRLIMLLAWLRMRGIRLVWTVHNLGPHEPVRPRLESALSHAVSRICHALVAHSAYARERILERWGSAKVAVIPHGNYVGLFAPPSATREALRGERGIPPDAYVFLAFGQIRPYKHLPDLLRAFGALTGDDDVRLLIVGKPVVAEEAQRLQDAAAADDRVLLDLREVPDAEVAGLHLSADAAVLAYRDVFSSGALLLALSLGLPVVAPDRGTAAEIAGPAAGELFGPGELTAALDRARGADRVARTDAARAVAERYGWDRVGRETAGLYRRLMALRR